VEAEEFGSLRNSFTLSGGFQDLIEASAPLLASSNLEGGSCCRNPTKRSLDSGPEIFPIARV
jgi:hypothetical protein